MGDTGGARSGCKSGYRRMEQRLGGNVSREQSGQNRMAGRHQRRPGGDYPPSYYVLQLLMLHTTLGLRSRVFVFVKYEQMQVFLVST